MCNYYDEDSMLMIYQMDVTEFCKLLANYDLRQ